MRGLTAEQVGEFIACIEDSLAESRHEILRGGLSERSESHARGWVSALDTVASILRGDETFDAVL